MNYLTRNAPFSLPIKVIQFGEGNFLRGFIDWQIDLLNERQNLNAGVVVIRPRGHTIKPLLDEQGGLFTVLSQGLNEHGQAVKAYRQVTCVAREINAVTMFADFIALARNPDTRFVISNTTEAGIVVNNDDQFNDAPPSSFPAKLTRLLFERFSCFNGAIDKGWVMLPCELIEHNGAALKAAVLHFAALWQLSDQFVQWINQANTFCSTLVDRIVTGYPSNDIDKIEAELGYRDQFLVAAEYYYVFIIQGPDWVANELNIHNANLNIKLVDDIAPYRHAKVGILNGGHTTLVPVGLLAGLESVSEAVADARVGRFLRNALYDEIIPALPMPQAEMRQFADDVLRRFQNPFIHHRLEAIALNSWSKFAARVMPQIKNYQRIKQTLPRHLVIALAANFCLYRGKIIPLSDQPTTLEWFAATFDKLDKGELNHVQIVTQWFANVAIWGEDMNNIEWLTESVAAAFLAIDTDGIEAYFE